MSAYREIIVYVEGPSDAEGMKILFKDLVEEKLQDCINIRFVPSAGKKKLLNEKIKQALNAVLNRDDIDVVLMPDLYPRNQGFDHETAKELFDGIQERLRQALTRKASDDRRVLNRIHTFCFKHDFECLVLAASHQLKAHLDVSHLDITWADPVEDQNHNDPPKRVVERVFESCGETYVATEDAFEILAHTDYRAIADACPQQFKRFVDFLEAL